MISPIVKKSMEHMTSTVISFVVIMVAVAIAAMLSARFLGGKSQLNRQIIFWLIVIGGGYFAGMYLFPSA